MRPWILLAVLSFYNLFDAAAGQRRGGGSGGGGAEDQDEDLGGGGGGIDSAHPDPDSPREFWQPDCGGLGGPDECACRLYPRRIKLFALLGLYYNGTLTVRHRIEDSSAWALDDLRQQEEPFQLITNYTEPTCPRDDDDTKTYTYPAMFHAGPRGSASDPNPLHWSLKAFQPAEETIADRGPYVDLYQRWVHIRSSDFYVYKPHRSFDYWAETNANAQEPLIYMRTWDSTTTQAYWETSIEQARDGSYSAKTLYNNEPDSVAWRFGAKTPRSQYLTLKDVCMLGQSSGSMEQGRGNYTARSGEAPTLDTVRAPTIFLPQGTEARIDGIGSDKLTFKLDAAWVDPVSPHMGGRVAQCDGENDVSGNNMDWLFEEELVETVDIIRVRRPSPYLPEGTLSSLDWAWNFTVSVALKFEGSLVAENSTEINGTVDGILQFANDYDWQEMERELGYPGADSSAWGINCPSFWLAMVVGAVSCWGGSLRM